MRPDPLDGIRVLDLTRLLPGPLCTQHLADLGADVIKVEDTGAGDYARGGLGMGISGPASYFPAVNRNKRSITLDLKDPRGRELFLELADGAAAIVEGFRPGVVRRLGIDYETVRERNPRIVYCAITGYGQTGPYRDRAGHDLNYCGYTGVTDQTGAPGGEPVISSIQIADLAGGTLSAAMGILAGLVDAERTGEGRYIDVAMADCVLAHSVFSLATHNGQGPAAPRGEDLLTGGSPCYGVYPTSDGRHMAVAALEAKFWRRLCEALGRPDLIERHAVTGEEARQVRETLTGIFRSRTQAEWMALFEGVDCCVSPVLHFHEALAHPQFRARNVPLREQANDDAAVGAFAFPLKMSEFAFSQIRPAPAQGEHTAEVLAELGYDEGRIARLRDAGVV